MPPVHFVTTRWSVVAAAGAGSAEGRAALAWLVERAWEPLRAHVKRKGWPNQDCEDLVQSFLARIIERGDLATADAERGRFRSWLLTCLDHFLANEAEARKALKRGGGRAAADIDVVLPAVECDPAEVLERAWARDWALDLLTGAMNQLEREQAAKPERWAALAPFLSGSGDSAAYAAAGTAIGLGEGAVKVAVHRLRQRLRELLRSAVAETLADPSPAAVEAELGELIRALG